jgi:hypothetical protein
LHGLIFVSFLEFTRYAYPDLHEAIWKGEFDYSPLETYPDESLVELLARTAHLTGRPTREIELAFGTFTARTAFLRLQPSFYRESGSTRRFLLDVEARIHEVVRATVRDAAPPRLRVVPLGEGVSITYTSERQLCAMLEGLVVGTASHYEEAYTVEQVLCVHRGDMACVFHASPISEMATSSDADG